MAEFTFFVGTRAGLRWSSKLLRIGDEMHLGDPERIIVEAD